MIYGDIATYAENNWANALKPINEISEGIVTDEALFYSFDDIVESMFRRGFAPTSADCIIITDKNVEVIEFKQGFKRNISNKNFDENKCKCPRDEEIICKDYAALLFKCGRKEIEELKTSIRSKAIESYIALEKDILPKCEHKEMQHRIKFIAVVDAESVDAMEDTLSELAGHDGAEENDISSIKQSLQRLKIGDPKGYYYDDISVLTPYEFQKHLKQL